MEETVGKMSDSVSVVMEKIFFNPDNETVKGRLIELKFNGLYGRGADKSQSYQWYLLDYETKQRSELIFLSMDSEQTRHFVMRNNGTKVTLTDTNVIVGDKVYNL